MDLKTCIERYLQEIVDIAREIDKLNTSVINDWKDGKQIEFEDNLKFITIDLKSTYVALKDYDDYIAKKISGLTS